MITDFWKGFITGAVALAVVFGVVLFFVLSNVREKEIIRYVEIQREIEELREDYVSRDPVEFIDAVPGVRESVDGAYSDFERKRDEALYRFRSGLAH